MECPLCGGNCQNYIESGSNAIRFDCMRFKRSYKVSAQIDCPNNDHTQRRFNHLIFEHVIREPFADEKDTLWHFYFEPDYKQSEYDDHFRVNLAEIPYPRGLSEKVDRILLNLYYINSSYGHLFNVNTELQSAFFTASSEEDISFGIASTMVELEYLVSERIDHYKIAAKGWQRIEELLRDNFDSRQAFIAMAFRDETVIIRNAFKEGIQKAGYTPLTIDEKEHNNQIVPEIFLEIDKSKFLVMDVTYPNYGAYYEAGYALGKGKQVIICCREEEFHNSENRPHFDIAQKSMIVWKTESELVEKLIKRIAATIK